jgi:hypothetical protein
MQTGFNGATGVTAFTGAGCARARRPRDRATAMSQLPGV